MLPSHITPKEGWAHVGCPTCGTVAEVPLDRAEPPPWCIHSDGRVVWREPHPTSDWTRTVRVAVAIV